jgi:hypothetical protein
MLQLLGEALEHVGQLDASTQLESCRKAIRRAEKFQRLQPCTEEPLALSIRTRGTH